MDNVIYSIFLFIIIPMILMIGFTENRQKATIGFMALGIAICLVASELNTIVINGIHADYFYYTVTFSPMIEEFLKAIPLIYAVFFFVEKPEKEKVVTWGFATGVGFAVFENIIMFFQGSGDAGIIWAVSRGLGAGLVHGLCTGFFGMGLCIIKDFRKPYFFGIFSLLSLTAIYHGMYNCMVQSDILMDFGICLPIITYILLYILFMRMKKKKSQKINSDKGETK